MAVLHVETGTVYPSMRLASEALGVSRVFIKDSILGKRNNTLGMTFRAVIFNENQGDLSCDYHRKS